MRNKRTNLLGALGRILLSLYFLLTGLQQFFDFESADVVVVRALAHLQLPLDYHNAIAAAAIACHLLWGTLLLIGRWVRLSSLMLIIFTLVWSLLLHPFWAEDGLLREQELLSFVSQMALVGALTLLIAYRRQCASISG